MERIKCLILTVAIVALGIMHQGCATILGGKRNTLVFKDESIPVAQVFIDGKFIGNAPGRIKLHKGEIQHGSKLEIKADGYEKMEYLILRKQNPVYSVIDILIGGLPLAIDYLTGNIYRPFPRSFQYTLKKTQIITDDL